MDSEKVPPVLPGLLIHPEGVPQRGFHFVPAQTELEEPQLEDTQLLIVRLCLLRASWVLVAFLGFPRFLFFPSAIELGSIDGPSLTGRAELGASWAFVGPGCSMASDMAQTIGKMS